MSDDSVHDPELILAMAHVPPRVRPALSVLWKLDERLSVIALAPNRPIAAIKLAWWREALERLDHAPPPAEPLLRELADTLLPAGISGAELAGIAIGWDRLLDDDMAGDLRQMLEQHARERGGGLFGIAGRLLGAARMKQEGLAVAGRLWALAHVPGEMAGAARRAGAQGAGGHRYWPRRLRPLGMLAVLARDTVLRADARPGSRRRIGRAMWHLASGW